VPHDVQAILAKYRGGHARRAVRTAKVEARTEIELAREHVADFISWIAQLPPAQLPRTHEP